MNIFSLKTFKTIRAIVLVWAFLLVALNAWLVYGIWFDNAKEIFLIDQIFITIAFVFPSVMFFKLFVKVLIVLNKIINHLKNVENVGRS